MRNMKSAALAGLAALFAAASVGLSDPTPAATTGTLTGIVRGQDGKPAAGATVKLAELKNFTPNKTADDPAKKKDKKAAKALQATTDDKGVFKIENVPAGQYTVTAAVKGTSRGKNTVLIEAGKTKDVSISMHAAAAK